VEGIPRRRTALLALALALGTCATFGAALSNDFVTYDDDVYVTGNPTVLGGLTARGVAWAFSEFHSANWHPLTWLSHMLDVSLFDLAPAGHHATSVLLHAANAALLFLFLCRTTGRAAPAFVAAALFALHPLRVESVAWVSERKDVLSGLFFFLVLLAWERHARMRTPGSYAAALGFYGAGLLAKPMLVTLPLVLLVLERWPLRRVERWGPRIREKLPFFALALVSATVTLLAQRSGGTTSDLEHLPLGMRLENAALACFAYLRQTVAPLDLACFYPHPGLRVGGAPLLLPSLAELAALAALTIVLVVRRKTLAPLAAGWATFLIQLLPVIGIVQVGIQSHADRYTYLPSAFLIAGVVFVLASIPGVLARRAGAVLAVAALAGCAVLTPRQVATWRDSVTLWENAARKTEGNYLAFWRLGEVERERGDLAAAERAFERSLEIRDDLPDVHGALGGVRLELGEPERALPPLERAHEMRPRDPQHALNLAGARIAAGELDSAQALLEDLARRGEDGAELQFDLGLLAQARGDARDAERRYRAALDHDPRHGSAWNNLGEVRLAVGDAAGAVEAFERLVELEPSGAGARYNLGCAYDALGDRARAREAYRHALELDPDLAPAAERLRSGE
jgi:tetratricopeptide (TPR) repeat protein